MRPLTLLLLVWSAITLALRIECARAVDFGDAEALYAVYSYFPAPSYLDHPGLIGQLYAWVGDAPQDVHMATALFATLLPWLLRAALRFSAHPAADPDRATRIALYFSVIPVVGVGMFALTPDWPLAVCVLLGLAFAVRADNDENRRAAHRFAAGALIGFSAYGKLSGLAFVVALAVTWLRAPTKQRLHAGWLGLVLGLVPLGKVVSYEAARGWPMLHHRLAPTLASVGRGLGMLTLGQLLYLSPLVALLLVGFVWQARRRLSPLLWTMLWLPAALLALAGLASPQTEPHWLAPLLLPLAFAAHADDVWIEQRARLQRWAFGVAAGCTVLVHVWVLVPATTRLWPGDRRSDIARELFGQTVLRDALLRTVQELEATHGVTPVVVGPHWTLCAKLRLALPRGHYAVGCVNDERDDFDTWAPDVEKDAPLVVWVTDDRFEPEDSVAPFTVPGYHAISKQRVRVFRGGTTARTFAWRVMQRDAEGSAQ